MNECYLNYPFGDCDNCKDITTRQTCIQGSTGYCGCKRKLGENDWKRTCELCGAIVCSECRVNDEHGESYCKTCSEKYVEGDGYDLINGDCLEEMRFISDKSVDMILCDLPYGTTRNKWDTVIPFDKLWEQYNRIIKDNGAIVLFAQNLFSARLLLSNDKLYRHKWVWNKNNSAGFANVNKMPFQTTEDILVFSRNKVNYYPIMEERGRPRNKGGYSKSNNYNINSANVNTFNNLYHPKHILNFSNANQRNKVHPTQKPVDLLEYLIKTYTKENQLVLDNCMGSGSTGVACLNTNRRFVGIELDKQYFETAKRRIEDVHKEI